MGKDVGERSGAQAVERAIQVLDCFGGDDTELTLSQVARRAGLALSTTHRIIGALVRGGLLERDATDHYQIGQRLAALAPAARPPVGVDEAIPHLYSLAAGIKLTVSLGVADDNDVLTVVSARPPVKFCSAQIPSPREPLHASAMGKTMLAFAPDEPRLATGRHGPLDPFTGRTHTSPTALTADLDEIRHSGFALSDEERTEGVRAIAVPVFGTGHKAVGALGVQAMSRRLTDDLIHDIVPALHHFAAEVGRRLRIGDATSA